MKNIVDNSITDYDLINKIEISEYNYFNNLLYSSIHDRDYYFYPFFYEICNDNNNALS
ncbi:hypothetical protein CPAST_c21700 [Clostridium pasteurianum DSM 525 = ATCC 6013]|uniref:Uncharacterized protein n=1 Tax=Clostridium pasteurianum DSM 525 = ATCC 6013 TaxID=1262449 RepID=A0A0H3JA45_CLOPA|nr:hypothetical protein [Clostridium pasteurianum]AJA48240.1 hypothetical protein CPAST_c21700 [Clostridium pasteurianum DSM 525 = ATCC 6013]AJA52228.1 hypothetical protein CLPA_c21700 [Clostridium pasteurianum DSM 525 = ATCC 6013]KRU11762.1 hypothetical protein CP6013_01009 [Clostridium pasteurianum DSM 525 = ATCC 6013]UZW12457.1 hypothetical protein OSC52_11370 [Clostridium pasteurianum]